MKLIKRGKCN